MSKGPYTVEISRGTRLEFPTITACRKWVEQFGTTADQCNIYNRKGQLVAQHRRDTSGKGDRWFRAEVSQ